MSVDDSGEDVGFEMVERRRLMLGGLAAVAGAGVVASVVEPAAAANGGPVILGASNTATATTQVTTTTGNGLQGQTTAASRAGVRGIDAAGTGGSYGVWGSSSKGTGVYGTSNRETYSAVLGRNTSTVSPGGWGVRGVASSTGTGVRGETSDIYGHGVHGIAPPSGYGAGVRGAARHYGEWTGAATTESSSKSSGGTPASKPDGSTTA